MEIDATEFAHARKDPAVRRLLMQAELYGESLRPEQEKREDQDQPRNLSEHQEDDHSKQVAQDAL